MNDTFRIDKTFDLTRAFLTNFDLVYLLMPKEKPQTRLIARISSSSFYWVLTYIPIYLFIVLLYI